MKKFEELKSIIEDTANDCKKFYEKGNSAAGRRVRKAMQEVKAKAQEIRIDIQDKKNN